MHYFHNLSLVSGSLPLDPNQGSPWTPPLGNFRLQTPNLPTPWKNAGTYDYVRGHVGYTLFTSKELYKMNDTDMGLYISLPTHRPPRLPLPNVGSGHRKTFEIANARGQLKWTSSIVTLNSGNFCQHDIIVELHNV